MYHYHMNKSITHILDSPSQTASQFWYRMQGAISSLPFPPVEATVPDKAILAPHPFQPCKSSLISYQSKDKQPEIIISEKHNPPLTSDSEDEH